MVIVAFCQTLVFYITYILKLCICLSEKNVIISKKKMVWLMQYIEDGFYCDSVYMYIHYSFISCFREGNEFIGDLRSNNFYYQKHVP